jgi:hypothetical protein
MIRQISIVLLSIGVMTAAGSVTSCSHTSTGDIEQGGVVPDKTIEQVLEERTDEWMAIPGVEGTAIGLFEDKPCIRIFSSSNPQQLRAKIPSTVEGYPVIIEETGQFRALEQQ